MAAGALGDDAFEPMLSHRPHQFRQWHVEGFGIADCVGQRLNDLAKLFAALFEPPKPAPDDTVIDGEIVARRAFTMIGNRRLKSWLRDQSCALRPDLRPMARKPSSFSS